MLKIWNFSMKKTKIRTPNSKCKLGKRENHEKQTFGSWLTVAPVCFQAPTNSSSLKSFSPDVWCGGGLGKQRMAQPRGGSKGHGENSFFLEIVLLRRSVWQWWRFDVKEEVKVWALAGFLSSFCLEFVVWRGLLSVKLVFSTWRFLIGWCKTLVLHQFRS